MILEMPEPLLVAIGGPTGSGKTEVIEYLIKHHPNEFARAPSFTSRSPRVDDRQHEYRHMNEETMQRMHKTGKLLNLDHVYGNLYGISSRDLVRIANSGRLALKEVHPSKHASLRRSVDIVSVLLLPHHPIDSALSLTWDNERRKRLAEDDLYYSALDPQPFDIIRPIPGYETPKEIAEHLRMTILALLNERRNFPPSPQIDAVNLKGYSLVAREFVDERRVTTAAFHRLSVPFFQSVLARFVGQHTRTLELGPGSGWLRSHFSWSDTEYSAVELSGAMLDAHLVGTGADYRVASVRATPFPSNHFDAAFASLADPFCYPTALCELWRVLKPGAVFAFTAPAAEWSYAFRTVDGRARTVFALSDGQLAEVFSFTFDHKGLERLLAHCGFTIREFELIRGGCLGEDPPDAIVAAARRLGLPRETLGVLNCVLAEKREACS
jgi:guanylate kinase/SAM-dependent methyltransferase